MPDPRRIVIAGHLCLDEIVTTVGIVHAVGSPAMFIAPVLAAAGCAVSIAAPYGRDFTAALARSGPRLARLDLLDPPQDAPTLVFVNDVRGVVRRQSVRHPDSARLAAPGPVTLRALSTAAALLVTPLLADPAPDVIAAYTAALPPSALRVLILQGYLRRPLPASPAEHRSGTDAVVGDHRIQATVPRTLDALFAHVDVVTLSDEDLLSPIVPSAGSVARVGIDPLASPADPADPSDSADPTAQADPADPDAVVARWSRAHPHTAFVITRGAAGSSAYLAGIRTDAPAHPVGALPPTALIGAGDTFAAELTLALLPAPEPAPAPHSRVRFTTASLRAALTTANHATAFHLAATSID